MKITESKLRKIIRKIIREGFAGPLSKSEQKKFESDRKKIYVFFYINIWQELLELNHRSKSKIFIFIF